MDLNQNTAQTEQSTLETAETVETVEVAKLETVEKAYFPSANIEQAQIAIGKATEIASGNQVPVTYNFDIGENFPTGYGIAIDHISKRSANGNVITGILVAAIHDYETVADFEGGASFIKGKVVDSMLAKLKNAVRPRGEDNTISASVPFSVTDFITSNRPEGILVAFREFAPAYVKMLKKKKLTLMTEAILRQTLQNAEFAAQSFPKITQDKWETILDSMIAKAEHAGIAAGILTEWKATRDSAELPSADVDLSDLDFDAMETQDETQAA